MTRKRQFLARLGEYLQQPRLPRAGGIMQKNRLGVLELLCDKGFALLRYRVPVHRHQRQRVALEFLGGEDLERTTSVSRTFQIQ